MESEEDSSPNDEGAESDEEANAAANEYHDCNEDEDAGDYVNGFDLDDDEYMDIDVESEDEWRSSFSRKPKYVHHHKRPGGPERPDTSGMTASMAKDARRS